MKCNSGYSQQQNDREEGAFNTHCFTYGKIKSVVLASDTMKLVSTHLY